MADPSTVYVGNLNFDTPASGLVTFMEAAGVFGYICICGWGLAASRNAKFAKTGWC